MKDAPTGAGARGIWWVDEAGKWRFVDPASAQAHVRQPFGPDPAHEAVGYRAIGCVKVAVDDTVIFVNWDVREVDPNALGEVQDFLERSGRGRSIILNFFYAGWNKEHWRSGADAVRRIDCTSAFRSIELIDTVLMARRKLFDPDSANAEISRGLKLWDRAGGRLGSGTNPEFSELSQEALIFSPRPDDGCLVFSHTGPSSSFSQIYGRDMAEHQVGLPSDYNGPDQAFAERVCTAYRQVLDHQEPRLDHIRALIHRDNGEPIWAAYQRLLMPWRRDDGEPLLVCLTSVTQKISIPFLEARSG